MSLSVAIHLPDRRRLDALASEADPVRAQLPWLDGLPAFDRIYFGVEFCQHLLPTERDVRAAAGLCRERDLGLTLVTPYGTDALLPKLERLLEAADAPDLEVLVSDWGVLQSLQDGSSSGRPVLGRLLNRMIRDPRVPAVERSHLGGDPPPDSWRLSSLGSRSFRALLDRLGVERVESDVPPQGLHPLAGDGPRVSVWLPFGAVASGRICSAHALGRPAEERFVPPDRCEAPCRRFEATLRPPWLQEQATRLLLKGNTHFYRLDDTGLQAALAWARGDAAVDRIVACPDLPM